MLSVKLLCTLKTEHNTKRKDKLPLRSSEAYSTGLHPPNISESGRPSQAKSQVQRLMQDDYLFTKIY